MALTVKVKMIHQLFIHLLLVQLISKTAKNNTYAMQETIITHQN